MLMKRWNTKGIVPFSMNSSLINIKLPCNTSESKCWTFNASELQNILKKKYNIWV